MQFLEKPYMQFKWSHKKKLRVVPTERQMKQKKNYEFTCRNLKVNTPPEGTDDILILAWIGMSLKQQHLTNSCFICCQQTRERQKKVFCFHRKMKFWARQDPVHKPLNIRKAYLINWWTKRGQGSWNTYTLCNQLGKLSDQTVRQISLEDQQLRNSEVRSFLSQLPQTRCSRRSMCVTLCCLSMWEAEQTWNLHT